MFLVCLLLMVLGFVLSNVVPEYSCRFLCYHVV